MKRYLAALLTLALVFSLCACSTGEPEVVERDCGVYITVEAADVYTVSCGTLNGSEVYSSETEGSPIAPGTVVHFDIGGPEADGSIKAMVDYSICAYDAELNLLADGSFSDDFSNQAKYELIITEDHHVLYDGVEYYYGGDTVISFETVAPDFDNISYMVPTVVMSTRPEAAEAINAGVAAYNDTFAGEQYTANKAAYGTDAEEGAELDPFSMSRTMRVMRGDASVISFRMADRANLGNRSTLALTCHSFDPQTGVEIHLSDIAQDVAGFAAFCAERVLIATTQEPRFLTESMIFVDGYTENIRNLISDGHWYFSADGLVIAANPGDISTNYYEFTLSYEDIASYLNEKYLPAERDGSYGNVSIRNTADCKLDKLSIMGTAPDESIHSLILTVAGTVYDVNVYSGIYNTETGKFTLDRQLIYCSDLMRGGAIAINREPSETPDLSVSFTCPDGTVRQLLVSADPTNGGLLLMDVNGGSDGIPVNGSASYDLNGDGFDEDIELVGGTLNVDGEAVVSDIASEAMLRIYDINGDGLSELYLSGRTADGVQLTHCYLFDDVLTEVGEPISGMINEFNGNRIFILAELDVLGIHPANTAFFYNSASDSFEEMDGFEYIFDGDVVLTAAVAMAMRDGTQISAGSTVSLYSTDGKSYVRVSTSEGKSGVLTITKDALGQWIVNSQPASVCFKELG